MFIEMFNRVSVHLVYLVSFCRVSVIGLGVGQVELVVWSGIWVAARLKRVLRHARQRCCCFGMGLLALGRGSHDRGCGCRT